MWAFACRCCLEEEDVPLSSPSRLSIVLGLGELFGAFVEWAWRPGLAIHQHRSLLGGVGTSKQALPSVGCDLLGSVS